MTDAEQVRDDLLRTDDEFRRLVEQHHELDSRVTALSGLPHRTGSEEEERITLKKRKLQLKDRIEQALRRHRDPSPEVVPALQPQPRG